MHVIPMGLQREALTLSRAPVTLWPFLDIGSTCLIGRYSFGRMEILLTRDVPATAVPAFWVC